jgi:hypothetical protein
VLASQLADGEFENFVDELERFCLQASRTKHFSVFGAALSQSVSRIDRSRFEAIRTIREALSQISEMAKIELKLLRGLQQNLAEAR